MESAIFASGLTLLALMLLSADRGPSCRVGERFAFASLLALSTATCSLHSLVTDSHGHSWPASVATGVIPGLMLVGAVAVLVRWTLTIRPARRQRRAHVQRLDLLGRRSDRHPDVLLIDSSMPLAYAVPGARRIVLSTGALDDLDDDSLHVVLAHEQAHIRYRHHHWLHLASACSLVSPGLQHRLSAGVESRADCEATKCSPADLDTLVRVAARWSAALGQSVSMPQGCTHHAVVRARLSAWWVIALLTAAGFVVGMPVVHLVNGT